MKTWQDFFKIEKEKEYFKNILEKLNSEISDKKIIYPEKDNIFKAFELTPLSEVKVVILGQDPYHGSGEAHGLSFSVKDGVKIPPSLQNIFKELKSDLGIIFPKNGNLEKLAREGVLLLNSILTVEKDTPGSHKDFGWQIFTDAAIKCISNEKEKVVFILWGKYAEAKENLIDKEKHLILKSPHPSPFSAHKGFFGSKPFSKANNFLEENNLKKINWDLS